MSNEALTDPFSDLVADMTDKVKTFGLWCFESASRANAPTNFNKGSGSQSVFFAFPLHSQKFIIIIRCKNQSEGLWVFDPWFDFGVRLLVILD